MDSYTILRSPVGVRLVSIRDLPARLPGLIDEVTDGGMHVLVTRNGVPEAALLPIAEYHAMEEMDAEMDAMRGLGLGDTPVDPRFDGRTGPFPPPRPG